MAHAVHADHESPLDLGDPREEPSGVAAERAPRRDVQECIDGDQDAEEPIPLAGHERVLEGDPHEEAVEEGVVVRAPGGGERDELAEGEERE